MGVFIFSFFEILDVGLTNIPMNDILYFEPFFILAFYSMTSFKKVLVTDMQCNILGYEIIYCEG